MIIRNYYPIDLGEAVDTFNDWKNIFYKQYLPCYIYIEYHNSII